MKKRTKPNKDKLVVIPWTEIAKHGTEFTLDFFDSMYVMNSTNLNFLYQKELTSNIGTKSVLPSKGALSTWAKETGQLFTVFERRRVRKVDTLYPIAVATFCDVDHVNRIGELKFVIRPNMYGKGYTRYVLRKLVDYAFNKLLMNNIILKVMKDDKTYATSNSIMKTPGFRKVGVMLGIMEAERQVKSVYIYQCSEEFYRRAKVVQEQ